MYYRDTHTGNDRIFNFSITKNGGNVSYHANDYNSLLAWLTELDKEFSKMSNKAVSKKEHTFYTTDYENPSIKYKNFDNNIVYTGIGTSNAYITLSDDSSDCNIKTTIQNYLTEANEEDNGYSKYWGSKTSHVLSINNQMAGATQVRAGKCTIQLDHQVQKVEAAGDSDEETKNTYQLFVLYNSTGHKTPSSPVDEITYVRIAITLDLLEKEVTGYSVDYKINNTAQNSSSIIRINTIEME